MHGKSVKSPLVRVCTYDALCAVFLDLLFVLIAFFHHNLSLETLMRAKRAEILNTYIVLLLFL